MRLVEAGSRSADLGRHDHGGVVVVDRAAAGVDAGAIGFGRGEAAGRRGRRHGGRIALTQERALVPFAVGYRILQPHLIEHGPIALPRPHHVLVVLVTRLVRTVRIITALLLLLLLLLLFKTSKIIEKNPSK